MHYSNKIIAYRELSWRVKNEISPYKISLTNGCFSLLHIGHIEYLYELKRIGGINSKLLVGVNSDNSVKELKGRSKLIIPENERAAIIASLECVDYVTIFDDTDAYRLIYAVKPCIYGKGGDKNIDTIPYSERELLRSLGVDIYFSKLIPNKSTTNIINSIKS